MNARLSSLVASAWASGFTPEFLEDCGFRVLPAAMRALPRPRHLQAVNGSKP